MADDKKINSKNESTKELVELLKEVLGLENSSIEYSYRKNRLSNDLVEIKKERLSAEKEGNIELAESLKLTEKEIKKQERLYKFQENFNKLRQQGTKYIKEGWEYLMESDKVIKTTTLYMGMSGKKAEELRKSFEGSARFVSRLGGSLNDVGSIMSGYADETGRTRALSKEMVEDIFLMGKGTGLGVEGGAKLAGQLEIMGLNAKASADYVQNVVTQTENMGVSATKTLKAVSDNFKTLQTFTFVQGVKGFANMAAYAEKMKMNMSETLGVAEKFRTLEESIDIGAKLQVMGGEFAKMDPFSMMHTARNNPEKFQEELNKMTAGLVSFRKMSDGTFEKFISPADQDRIRAVEKSLGLSAGSLQEQGKRYAEIQKARNQMSGMGLTGIEKEVVEGMAFYNTETNRMQVNIGKTAVDVNKLSRGQIALLQANNVSLEKRAEQAMTFDDTLKATILELKATLLPLLKNINSALEKFQGFSLGGKIATMVAASLAFSLAAKTMSKGLDTLFTGTGKLTKKMAKSVFSSSSTVPDLGGAAAKGGGSLVPASAPLTKAGKTMTASQYGMHEQGKIHRAGNMAKVNQMNAASSRTRGVGRMASGAGMGMAAVGIGAGIGLAAVGIAELAKAMKDLDSTQIWALPVTVAAIGFASFGMAAGIKLIGKAGITAAPGLMAVGVAAVGIGAGIGLAAFGISSLVKEMKGLDNTQIWALPVTMALIGASALGVAFGISLIGAAGITAAPGLMAVGVAAVGIGAGIGLAAFGISSLVKEMKGLDNTPIWKLPVTIAAIGLAALTAAPGLGLFATTSLMAIPGIMALTVAAVGVGVAIKLAGDGINSIAGGITNLIQNAQNAGPVLSDIGKGVGILSLSLAGMGLMGGATAVGLGLLNLTLSRIGKHAPQLKEVGAAFKEINAVLSGTEEDFQRVESLINSISSANIKSGNVFSELKEILNKPLKVEFADQKIAIRTDITLEIDRNKLINKTVEGMARIQKESKEGKSSPT